MGSLQLPGEGEGLLPGKKWTDRLSQKWAEEK